MNLVPGGAQEMRRIWQRWRWALYVLGLLGLAAGFGYDTPARQFARLRAADMEQTAAIDSLRDYAEHTHEEIELRLKLVTALARGECLDRPRRELDLMGLPCDSLLQRRP